VNLYALVASDSSFAVDLYVTRDAAESALRTALADEPGFAGLLSIVQLEDSSDGLSGGRLQ
jgi:hypothetical protein